MKPKIVAHPVSKWQGLLDTCTTGDALVKFNLLTLENVLQELDAKFGAVCSSKLDSLCKNPVSEIAHTLDNVNHKPNKI